MKFKALFLILIAMIPTALIGFVSAGPTIFTQPTVVDYVFSNGKIISVDDQMTIYQAIAIEDDTIVALGNDSEVLSQYEMVDSTYYDLEGQTMMPGIIDGHSHAVKSYINNGLPETFDEMQERHLSFGYTTLNEKSIFDPEYSELFVKNNAGAIRIRLNLFMIANFPYLDENNETIMIDPPWYDMMEPLLQSDEMLRIPGFKIWGDGAGVGDRGHPALSYPYSQEYQDLFPPMNDPYGDLYLNQSSLNQTVKAIHDRGFSVAIHAMGDRGVDVALNAFEFALDGEHNSGYRHQIEHSSFLRDNQTQRCLDMGTIHSLRGYFPTYYQEEDQTLFPLWMLEWYQNRFSLPDAGVHCFLETDFSYSQSYNVSDMSYSRNIHPFLHLWGLVTKKAFDTHGILHEPQQYMAEHLLSVEQALRVMTYEGAYAVKMENHTGSLEVGKFADFLVISDDPLTMNTDNLYQIENYLTMVAGNLEWQSEDFTLILKNLNTPRIPGYTVLYMIFLILGCSLYLVLQTGKILKAK